MRSCCVDQCPEDSMDLKKDLKDVDDSLQRLMAVQQLRAKYGINIKKGFNGTKQTAKTPSTNTVKVFGVQLASLPQFETEHGSVPRFLVDACKMLLLHVDTEGLFRKSGSIVRLKALTAKLDAGEQCVSTAVPCDVAGLVKQFFRELPEPILPTELHDAFLKAQELNDEEERTAATLLLSCVLPVRNRCVLRYFFDFLHKVSQRRAENKMNNSNLSVVFTPNFLHSGEGTAKMNAGTEKRLKLQRAVIHCFIDNAQDFGALPQFVMENVPSMLVSEASTLSPPQDGAKECLGMKRKRRRSFGDCGPSDVVLLSYRHAVVNSVGEKQPAFPDSKVNQTEAPRRSLRSRVGLGTRGKYVIGKCEETPELPVGQGEERPGWKKRLARCILVIRKTWSCCQSHQESPSSFRTAED